MTTITQLSHRPLRSRLHLKQWPSWLVEFGGAVLSSWRKRQSLRALEALPADTLKDIGWPSSDNKRLRIEQK